LRPELRFGVHVRRVKLAFRPRVVQVLARPAGRRLEKPATAQTADRDSFGKR
jgi:hypothetical protein